MEKIIVKETDSKPTYISMGDIQKKNVCLQIATFSSALVWVHILWEELRVQERCSDSAEWASSD